MNKAPEIVRRMIERVGVLKAAAKCKPLRMEIRHLVVNLNVNLTDSRNSEKTRCDIYGARRTNGTKWWEMSSDKDTYLVN